MKIALVILICVFVCGCSTIPGMTGNREVDIGMTKNQVFWAIGSPETWSRKIIDNKVYETWTYLAGTYDFVDSILIGYSYRGRYYSKDAVDDVRNYSMQ